VTPTSYLELLGTLVRLLGEKRAELSAGRRRLELGLDKLTASAAQVRGRGSRAGQWAVLGSAAVLRDACAEPAEAVRLTGCSAMCGA
jgi:hypothetical protein